MKDYNIAPTDEFQMITDSERLFPHRWFTMMKSVMNDYWFDVQDRSEQWDPWYLDHFIHKIYYCWLMMGREIFEEEE